MVGYRKEAEQLFRLWRQSTPEARRVFVVTLWVAGYLNLRPSYVEDVCELMSADQHDVVERLLNGVDRSRRSEIRAEARRRMAIEAADNVVPFERRA